MIEMDPRREMAAHLAEIDRLLAKAAARFEEGRRIAAPTWIDLAGAARAAAALRIAAGEQGGW
jgi:hypothetical protein